MNTSRSQNLTFLGWMTSEYSTEQELWCCRRKGWQKSGVSPHTPEPRVAQPLFCTKNFTEAFQSKENSSNASKLRETTDSSLQVGTCPGVTEAVSMGLQLDASPVDLILSFLGDKSIFLGTCHFLAWKPWIRILLSLEDSRFFADAFHPEFAGQHTQPGTK